MNVTVDPTRIKGNRRVFKNVIEATVGRMAYNPSDYDLMPVHEPGVGYRMVALDAVTSAEPAKAQKQSRNVLSNRGWVLAADEPKKTRNALAKP
jgi:hypothetical protein